MKKFLLAATLIASMGAAQAQSGRPPLSFLAGLGVSFGGDDLASASYTNGTSQTIKAGSGVYFTGGLDYRVSPAFSVQGTVNFHVDDTHASNGDITFQRFPIELLGYYHLGEQWRLGGGVRYVSSPKLSSSGAAAGVSAKFDNTVSSVIEGEYFPSPRLGLKLRYVKESFDVTGYRAKVNANHVGISGNFYF